MPDFPPKKQQMATFPGNNFLQGLTRYANAGGSTGGWLATETQCYIRWTVPGVIKNLRTYLQTNTLNGNLVITMRAGNPIGDTALTVTYGAGATGDNQDLVNSFRINNGDYITIKGDTTAAGAGACQFLGVSWEFDPD